MVRANWRDCRKTALFALRTDPPRGPSVKSPDTVRLGAIPLGKTGGSLHRKPMQNMKDGSRDAPAARPAATVVVFRRSATGGPAQVLLQERSGAMAFAGGATVFPGGAVDLSDHALVRALAASLPQVAALDPDDAAARVAAVREALEETGLIVGVTGPVTAARAVAARQRLLDGDTLGAILADEGWTIDFDSLIPFARWCPRQLEAKVYDTRFYLADVGTGALDLAADATETAHVFWASAQDALDLADAGRIRVIFPTRRNLERLALWPDFATARAHALVTPVQTISPWIELRDGVRWLMIPSDAGYPIVGEPLDGALRG
ncbi:NUDIX hydrolase [Novosphingobium sp.]|uniref:NUDIX hydrolase n=1 Tax=Novosphingobium sp. TaxID=1874826 RepID=UPI003B5169FD